MRGQLRARVALEERDELDLEHVRRRQIRGHHAQQSVRRQGGDALRHRRLAGAQIRKGCGKRVDELVEIEQFFDVGAREDEHVSSLSSTTTAPAGSKERGA